MRIAVISDTHSRPHPDSLTYVARQQPDAILHGGDIGDLAVLDRFAELAPLIAVRGNIDEHAADIPDSIDIAIVSGASDGMPTLAEARSAGAGDGSPSRSGATNMTEGEHVRLKILLTHIAVYGPKLRADAARLAEAHGAQLVVCGHSHVPFIGRDRGLTLFNPGSIGPRRMHLPITFGVLEVSATAASLRHMSCETGERWSP
jgi:putative phosphoesterase